MRLSLFLFAVSLFAADSTGKIQPGSANVAGGADVAKQSPLLDAQKIAFQFIAERTAQLSNQFDSLKAETCRVLLQVPADKMDECHIAKDLSSVVWQKKTEAPSK